MGDLADTEVEQSVDDIEKQTGRHPGQITCARRKAAVVEGVSTGGQLQRGYDAVDERFRHHRLPDPRPKSRFQMLGNSFMDRPVYGKAGLAGGERPPR